MPTTNNRTMEPEELLTLVKMEAINIIAFGGEDKEIEPHKNIIHLMTGVDVSEELAADALSLIQKEIDAANLAQNGSPMIHAVPDDSLMDAVNPIDMLRLLWSLFEMSVKLDARKDRQTAYALATDLMDSMDFESFIEQ